MQKSSFFNKVYYFINIRKMNIYQVLKHLKKIHLKRNICINTYLKGNKRINNIYKLKKSQNAFIIYHISIVNVFTISVKINSVLIKYTYIKYTYYINQKNFHL